jgi:hypothetical protein
MKTLAATSITPDDLLDAARTIPLGDISTCDWLSAWVPATVFLEWAQRGLAEADAYGLSNAVTYAKRAAACRIDLLLQYNHLVPFSGSAYPAKITALCQVGLRIPDVVHELVIHPRNAVEHSYEVPSHDVARHAVGIAELFVRATDAEHQRASIVAVAWNVLGSHGLTSEREYVQFRDFSDRPMLFIDVFCEPHTAKVVDPKNAEIRSASLSFFSNDQSIALAKLLRSNYARASLSQRGAGRTFFEEMKRQGAF